MIKPQTIGTDPGAGAAAALAGTRLEALIPWIDRQLTCSHCRRCTVRCEVLREPDLDIGQVTDAYNTLMALPSEERPAALIALMQERFDLYHALRRCCFCGYCTAACAHHVLGADRMRGWRELFSQSGLMPPQDSRLVMVDEEWNLFSAYRAIYGIAYDEFLSLDEAAANPGQADTLLFPGCSLVSYAPDLVRAVGTWMNDAGLNWAFSDACCASPLMSAGLFDRAAALRNRIVDAMRAAGITRMVTVCPGCGEEFAEQLAGEIEIVPLPELLVEGAAAREAAGAPSGFAPTNWGKARVTVFDSCHDRTEGRHGRAIRTLLERYVPTVTERPMPNRAGLTLCCGAGGAVASYDEDITKRRVWTVIDEARRTGADDIVTMCPTCAYTIAEALLGTGATPAVATKADPATPITTHHYLEYLFGIEIDWAAVFGALGAMWTGEYGPWLNETFFS